MSLRKTVSLLSLCCFVLLAATGLVLYAAPHGRVAYWADWRFAALTKDQWGEVHITTGLVFLLAGLLHVYYNWRAVTAYLKDRSRRLVLFTPEATAALALAFFTVAGTLAGWPPFSTALQMAESLKTSAAAVYGEPPYGHAELSSVQGLAAKTGLDPGAALERLREAGLALPHGRVTVLEVSRMSGLTPKEVFARMRPQGEAEGGPMGLPRVPPGGFGKRALHDVAAEYGLDLPRVLKRLEAMGLTVDPDATASENARVNGMGPPEFYGRLREAAG